MLVTRAEFARRCEVSKNRVGQWLDEGKINGEAVSGSGRDLRIDLELAQSQIRKRRDPGQTLGNGSATKVRAPKPILAGDPAHAEWEGARRDQADGGAISDDVQERIALERLDDLQRRNRLAAADEAHQLGRYTMTASVRAAMANLSREMLLGFEGALPDFAELISSEFKIDRLQILHKLQAAFRKFREREAERARKRADDLPALIADPGD